MFKVTFDTDTAAFEYPGAEIARVLRQVLETVNRQYLHRDYAWERTSGILRDRNGNTVGTWEFTPEPTA